jgi:hypothetical protein
MGRALRVAVVAMLAGALPRWAAVARAHVTPPVELVSDREAIVRLLGGAKAVAREVRLSQSERAEIQRRTEWKAEQLQRVHFGHDAEGRLTGSVAFVTEYTTHGAVRVAVGVGADGGVLGATVLEVSDEAYRWVRPLVEHDFAREYVGRDARGEFAPSERLERTATGAMSRFYARVLTKLVQRGAVLLDVAVIQRPPAPQKTTH